jgi:hypothetical protein
MLSPALLVPIAVAIACGPPAADAPPAPEPIDAASCNVLLLPPLPGDASSEAFGLGADVVVGVSRGARERPVEWRMLAPERAAADGWHCDAAQRRDERLACVRELPARDAGRPEGVAYDVGPKGLVVGASGRRPAVWRGANAQPVPGADAPGSARAVTEGQAVVGVFSHRPQVLPRPHAPGGAPDPRPTNEDLREQLAWLDGFVQATPGGAASSATVALFAAAEVRGVLWAAGTCRAPATPAPDLCAASGAPPPAALRAVVADAAGRARLGLDGSDARGLAAAPPRVTDAAAPDAGAAPGPTRVLVVGRAEDAPALWEIALPARGARLARGLPTTRRLLGLGPPAEHPELDVQELQPLRGRANAVVAGASGASVAGHFEHPALHEPRALLWREEGGGRDLNLRVWPACEATLEEAHDLDGGGRIVGRAHTPAGARGFLYQEGVRPRYGRVSIAKQPGVLADGEDSARPGSAVRFDFTLGNPYAAELAFDVYDALPPGLVPMASNGVSVAAAEGVCERGPWTFTANVAETRARVPAEGSCRISLRAWVQRWGPEPIVNADYGVRVGGDEVAGSPAVSLPVAVRPPSAEKSVSSDGPWRRWRFHYTLDPGGEPSPGLTAFERLPEGIEARGSAVPPDAIATSHGLDCESANAWGPSGEQGVLVSAVLVVGEEAFACDLLVEATGAPWPAGETRSFVNDRYGLRRSAGEEVVGPEVPWDVTRTENSAPRIATLTGPPFCEPVASGADAAFLAEVEDPDGDAVVSVELRQRDSPLASAGAPDASGTWSLAAALPDGQHCVDVVARDDTGLEGAARHCFGVGQVGGPVFDLTWLQPAPGAAESRAFALNDAGTVGGGSDDDGCVWDAAGARQCLADVAGRGPVTDINARGDYVGYGVGEGSFAVRDGVACPSSQFDSGRVLAIDDEENLLVALFFDHSWFPEVPDTWPELVDVHPVFLTRVESDPQTCTILLEMDLGIAATLGNRGAPGAPRCDASADPIRTKFDLDGAYVWGQAQTIDCSARYGLLKPLGDLEPLSGFVVWNPYVGPFFPATRMAWHGGEPAGRDVAVADLDPSHGFGVGSAGSAAALLPAVSTPLTLAVPPGSEASAVWDVNARNDLVGYTAQPSGERALYWGRCGPLPLDERVESGRCATSTRLEQARAINETGQIAGWGLCDGARRAFRLDPR